MSLPKLPDLDRATTVEVGGMVLEVQLRAVPAPEWHKLVTAARADDGRIDAWSNAADVLAAGVASVTPDGAEPDEFTAEDAAEVATTWPYATVDELLGKVWQFNTSGAVAPGKAGKASKNADA